ncbi:hypothetical protein glysoja_040175 [Glycine soja]|uniref:Uncharacterized protein n=1 Tax=Glycine soja TaxID=3848 RepID=A0A0B2R3R8_GLYSO|nr:hypothetical protein glysoja_040175 [Glycine soja]
MQKVRCSTTGIWMGVAWSGQRVEEAKLKPLPTRNSSAGMEVATNTTATTSNSFDALTVENAALRTRLLRGFW